MKKLLGLLLAGVLCLAAIGCGGTGTMENGEQSALQGNEKDPADGYQNHPFLQFMYGEWEYQGDHASNYPFTKLEIKQDGTCLVDGAAGTWDIGQRTSDGRLRVDVSVDGQAKGAAEITIWSGRSVFNIADTMQSQGDWWEHNTPVATDENDIALTTENWRQYFEIKTEAFYGEDAFGEISGLTLQQYLVLKEEYAQQMLATDVVYEMRTTRSRYPIFLDTEERSYTLGEVTKVHDPGTKEPQKLYCDARANRYQIEMSTNYIDAAENANPDSTSSKDVGLVPDMESIEMLRIQGNLYLVNP